MSLRKSTLLGLVGSTVIVFTPAAASAAGFSTIVTVAGAVATGVGIFDTALQLASLTGWENLPNDHPLYSTSTVSPTITITATETTFDLFVDQPLDLGETVDDLPVQISGIAKFDTVQGAVDSWSYNLTFTFNKDTLVLRTNTLDVSGFIRHVRAPHPELQEQPMAPPLDVDATVTKIPPLIPQTPANTTVNGPLDQERHVDGTHFDFLTRNRLQFTCCTAIQGDVTKWEYRAKAEHGATAKANAFLERANSPVMEAELGEVVNLDDISLRGAMLDGFSIDSQKDLILLSEDETSFTNEAIPEFLTLSNAGGEIITFDLESGNSWERTETNGGEINYSNIGGLKGSFLIDGQMHPGVGHLSFETIMGGGPMATVVESFETVPEPLSILGAGTAAGFGVFFKREVNKKKKGKKDSSSQVNL